MNKPLDAISRLAACARQETVPGVDVSPQVMAQLRMDQDYSEKPLLIFAFSASLAAIAVLIYALPMLTILTDPLSTLFQSIPALDV